MRVRRTGPWVKISCPFSWVQFRSRWGQRLGQEKATSENSNLCKAKVLEIRRFRGLLASYFILNILRPAIKMVILVQVLQL